MADRIVQPSDIRARQKMTNIPQQDKPRSGFPGLEQFHHAPFEEAQLLHLPVARNVYADRLFELLKPPAEALRMEQPAPLYAAQHKDIVPNCQPIDQMTLLLNDDNLVRCSPAVDMAVDQLFAVIDPPEVYRCIRLQQRHQR